ncbi:hypothetical protein BaRGS_00013262 [Batillaria attramentaria]|uniref:G-protein coupled receptors family 1 profile domain-containing protein n=1 Tax=Batillaria attramentaria TaxID=370345 RepID=A0ABD0L8X6_9CAEN
MATFSNNSSVTTARPFTGDEMSQTAVWILGFVHGLTAANGIVGSGLILYTLLTDQQYRQMANTYTVYMVNLVITDLYFETYFFPLLILDYSLGHHPVVNGSHCAVTAYLALTAYCVFLSTLVAISVDRYVCICHYVNYRVYCSRKRSTYVSLAIWIMGILIPLPAVFDGSLGFDARAHCCFIRDSDSQSYSGRLLSFMVLTVLFSASVPNFQIYRIHRNSRRRVGVWQPGQCQSNGTSIQHEGERHTPPRLKVVSASDIILLRSLIVVFVCLLVFLAPAVVVRAMRKSVDISPEVYGVVTWLLSVNSSINWIIYGLMNGRFRNGYRRALNKCKSCLVG